MDPKFRLFFFFDVSGVCAYRGKEVFEMIPGSSPISCEKAREMLKQRSRVRWCVYVDDG
jgi:hypothetical protein